MTKTDLDALGEHYGKLFREHGDSPQAGQWSDLRTQEARLEALVGVGDLRRAKVLDFGCGTAHLLAMLKERGFEGVYVGYDLSEELIGHARSKFPDARFERRNVMETGVPERFDYVFISGVFNNRVADNWQLMTSLLRILFRSVDQALAFNNLSTYVDFFDPGLYYADPAAVFEFCKSELSPRVTLRHDYEVRSAALPFEFTTYVYASPIPCRKRQVPGAR
jgi:SAM-dependent methyltransferase